ncbi:MAG: HD domain-containing protein [Gammaproteobacteria bacterium]|nr:HD domain-containing protein [Gammaproteobacteria bacterium]
MSTFNCPAFCELEQSLIDDFNTCFEESVEEIEECLKELESNPGDGDGINRLFRSMHSLKGNCRMVFLDPLVELTHQLEEIVEDIRQGRIAYFPACGEFLLSAISQVESLIGQLMQEQQANRSQLDRTVELIRQVRAAGDADREDAYQQALDELVGLNAHCGEAAEAPRIELIPQSDSGNDMNFFRMLSGLLDNLNIYRRERSNQVLKLALALNLELGGVVDAQQLAAAVYMHDVGMAFVPHPIFNKESPLSPEEAKLVRTHVVISAQLLHRILGWEDASQMVLQHHERYDGEGYPNRLAGEDIHPGARIIAITDTFCALTNERSDRNYKKSLFSAITEVNKNVAAQFDPHYVDAFNMVVRKLYISNSA